MITSITTPYPMTPSLKRAINLAAQVASEMGQEYIGTEHLVVAILQLECVGEKLLKEFGLSEKTAREQLPRLQDPIKAREDEMREEIRMLKERIKQLEDKESLASSVIDPDIKRIPAEQFRLAVRSCPTARAGIRFIGDYYDKENFDAYMQDVPGANSFLLFPKGFELPAVP